MHVQSRDADVASAELIEEKRLSRELSAQVQEFTEGLHLLGLLGLGFRVKYPVITQRAVHEVWP